MAPEVFAKTGYTWTVDWWSLGVVVYECIYGKRPFRGADNDLVQIAICNDDLHIPKHNLVTKKDLKVTEECASFLKGLLDRNIDTRLGCKKARFEEVMAHPWFAAYDWEKLDKKELDPEFVPNVRERLVVESAIMCWGFMADKTHSCPFSSSHSFHPPPPPSLKNQTLMPLMIWRKYCSTITH